MLSRKAELTTGMMAMIIILLVTAGSLFYLVSTAYAGVEAIDHKECRATIAIAEGINIQANTRIVRAGVAPSSYCPAVIINEFPEEKFDERKVSAKEFVKRQIILKMDSAWYATWRNQIDNTYKDFWVNDHVCKKLYEFTIDDDKIQESISRDELALAIEEVELEHLGGVSFGRAVRSNGGDIFIVPEEFIPKNTYQILVYGPPEGNNAIILVEAGTDNERIKVINAYVSAESTKKGKEIKCGIIKE